MNVISLKDYAKRSNISYEAVRKQVVRYEKDLKGHLIRDGRQQFLDEEAVAFLDAKRQKNPVAIIQIGKDERIKELEEENKTLLKKLAMVQDALLAEKEKNQALIADQNGKIALLEADNEAAKGKIAQAEKAAQEAQEGLVKAHDDFENELSRVNETHQKELEERDERIQALENRTFGDYFKGLFKKK